MSDQMVIGIFDTYDQATKAVELLIKAKFTADEISILGADPDELRVVAADLENDKPGKFVTTAGILGAVGGFAAGLVSLAIPGVGSFLAAGPLMAAITGAAAGSMLGVIAGGLIRFDVPEYDAKVYETHLTKGKVLLAVHTADHDKRVTVEDILDDCGAIEVSTKKEPVAAKS